jgi:hypothetical protein
VILSTFTAPYLGAVRQALHLDVAAQVEIETAKFESSLTNFSFKS